MDAVTSGHRWRAQHLSGLDLPFKEVDLLPDMEDGLDMRIRLAHPIPLPPSPTSPPLLPFLDSPPPPILPLPKKKSLGVQKGQRARRTSLPLGRREAVRIHLLNVLQDLEKQHGRYLVGQELDRMATEWTDGYNYLDCFYCEVNCQGVWYFCSLSVHNPHRVDHRCPEFHDCSCNSLWS